MTNMITTTVNARMAEVLSDRFRKSIQVYPALGR
jgi:hypothetical protein